MLDGCLACYMFGMIVQPQAFLLATLNVDHRRPIRERFYAIKSAVINERRNVTASRESTSTTMSHLTCRFTLRLKGKGEGFPTLDTERWARS